MTGTENIQQAINILTSLTQSGFIPFSSPSPSSTEAIVKHSVKDALFSLRKALSASTLCYGNPDLHVTDTPVFLDHSQLDMWNSWLYNFNLTQDICRQIWGADLGDHLWRKFSSYPTTTNPSSFVPKWLSDMTAANRHLLYDYVSTHYNY